MDKIPRVVVITAVASSAFSIALTLCYQSLGRVARRKALELELEFGDHHADKINNYGIPEAPQFDSLAESDPPPSKHRHHLQPDTYDPMLIEEQLTRNRAFLGDGLDDIRKANVVIVGAGGVGSWAATMLVRSGVGRVRIIDFDQVTLSSLNRHACATLGDVGTAKVTAIANYLNQVAPWCVIEPIVALWDNDNADIITRPLKPGDQQVPITYVIDAIDNVDTKVDLLAYCAKNNFPVICSMGAGCKADPTRVTIADISMSLEDPLARSVRRRLRLKGVVTGIPTVFSTEKPGKNKASLLPLDDEVYEQGDVDQLAVLQDFRVRILPVLGPLPAIFGLTIATHLLTTIGEYAGGVTDPLQGGYSLSGKFRMKLYDTTLQTLAGQIARQEKRRCQKEGTPELYDNSGLPKVPLDLNTVGYLIEEVFRGKSVISGEFSRLALTQWDPEKPLQLGNIALVTKDEQKSHELNVLSRNVRLEEFYDANVIKVAKGRFEEDEWYQKFR